jgi:hypothetical protein
MHAAKDYELRRVALRAELRELEGVARYVRMTDHVVALVVMTENDESLAEHAPRPLDALVQLRIRQSEVVFKDRRSR